MKHEEIIPGSIWGNGKEEERLILFVYSPDVAYEVLTGKRKGIDVCRLTTFHDWAKERIK